jgi:hypothetical protein
MSRRDVAGEGRRGGAQPIALIDLGGTLCDCSERLRDGLARLDGAPDPPGDGSPDVAAAHREARRRLVMAAPGFWRELPPLAVGFELLELVRELGFRVHVVTKGPHDVPAAWANKVSWCRRHLPGVPVIVTDSKTLIFGHVLIDDWPPYVHDWQRQWPEALAVVPVQPWNDDLPLGARVLRYDSASRVEVRDALRELSAGVTSPTIVPSTGSLR